MKGISDAFHHLMIVGCLASAVVGWAVIEGLIWLFCHLTIGWKP